MNFKRRWFHLFVPLMLFEVGAHSQSRTPVGKVLRFSGQVHLQSPLGPSPDEKKELTPGNGRFRDLYDSDAIWCTDTGKAEIVVYGKKKTIAAKDGVVRIHLDRPPTHDELLAESKVRHFGMPGGSRGIGSVVWWPAAGSAVRVATFQVRWNPPSTPASFNVSLTSETNETLWSAEGADSTRAGLSDEQNAATKAILLARQSETKPEKLTLTLTSEMQGSLAIEFTILSKQEERKVDAELQAAAANTEEDPLLRIVDRAETLRSADLLCELAAEYDAALKVLPGSESLLQAARVADRTIGNVARAREIDEQLKFSLLQDAVAVPPK